ncbi:alpha-IPM isomerase [Paraburkholderia sp. Ac-20336]|uniref:LeuD/DmdB family oxidoreductase small subunit n=1 Tax=Burkholderiaceae TaxID=119060 RepID=UPI001420FD64|nr:MULTISPECIES: alpha-IPM isomerase [Burkholderiaceae]MBN3801605.1 alpha-IPM isomerase [Paraburkholderia sp. Ac-20336]MBN3846560.1 alpha-IPM isomerase [Paraburkholderia sp. Ac-20342]NIF55646.1 alpha-IPM isomerase [Burkholderia sp. Ax-1724]NIF77968.1 alpha-IPM isomerase [Paraburkholderia sp. Cy-641]
MTTSINGMARRFGDDVNTDYIISSRRKRESLDPAVLKQYLFETIAPEFAASVRAGDIVVAGKNFGCGSAMEVAVTAVVGAGIKVVLAQSFARTYFRNAVNNGLYPIECDTSRIAEGAALSIELGEQVIVRCEGMTEPLQAAPIARDMLAILDAGGLVPYLLRNPSF